MPSVDGPVFALHSISRVFGVEAAARKETLLKEIACLNRMRVNELTRLQDTLNFMRAYPDNRRILRLVTDLVAKLRRHSGRAGLRNTGFPGSSNSHTYSYAVLQRMVRLFPGCFEIDWDAVFTRLIHSPFRFAESVPSAS